jgi:nucleotide-binding universal stress UspA family protein
MASLPKAALSLKHILFTTDFTAASSAALPFAAGLARRYGANITVLHVVPPEPKIAVPLDVVPDLDKVRITAEQQMSAFVNDASLHGISHDQLLERGPVWEEVSTVVDDRGIDLIVLGTHGRHGIKRFVLGSVAEEIFRQAKCPVLTIGPEIQHDGIAEGIVTRILFATDFSPGSLHALPYAISLAEEHQARITMLHVIEEVDEATMEFLDQQRDKCVRQLTSLLPAGVKGEYFVEYGPVADTILKIAAEEQVNLIIMGARHASFAVAHVPWPAVHSVVCHAHCPVLTVRS